LTPEEFAVIKQHTVQGAHIVEPLRSIRSVTPLIRWHHERCDGKGYPDGLDARTIPLMVRILSVADVFDSLASRRPYRAAIPHDECLEVLRNDAAKGGLDPELVRVFCKVMEAGIPSQVPTRARSARRKQAPHRPDDVMLTCGSHSGVLG
jgi:putative two-component system response regulator